jgi:hypothetical protein
LNAFAIATIFAVPAHAKSSKSMQCTGWTWTVTVTDPSTGSKTDIKARYSLLYRIEDSAWKIDHLHSSMMPEKTG